MSVHRWPQSLSLLLAGLVLGAPVVGLSAIHQSGVEAIHESVRGEFGYAAGWKLQATKSAASAVAQSPGVTAVRVDSATVATGDARTEATFWSLSDAAAPLGLLLDRRRAEVAGEATVSRHLADTLELRLGSQITLPGDDDESVKVVGITTDPGDRSADLVIRLTSQKLSVAETTYWITPEVSPELDVTPGLTASSVGGSTQARLEHTPGPLVAVKNAIPAIAALTVLVMLTAVAAQALAARRDVEALEAAGMTPARSWRVVFTWMAVLVTIGAVTGALTALAALNALDDQVSGALGQRWTAVSLPVVSIVLVTALPLLLAVTPVRPLEAWLAWLRREDKKARGTGTAALVAGTVLAAIGLTLLTFALLGAREKMQVQNPEILGLLGILSVALGVRLAANRIVGIGQGRATRELTRRLAGQLTVGTSVAVLVGAACASYAAWHTHNTYAFANMNVAPQASGSYLVYEAPASAADKVLDRYRAVGGENSFLYQLPDESRGSTRVTHPNLIRCIEAGPPDDTLLNSCLQSEGGVMNIPALDPSLSSGDVRVEKGVTDSGGGVGVVSFGPDGSVIRGTDTFPAVISDDLGGNMPGMIISPDNPLAKKYNLAASGLVEFGMMDFGELNTKDAAQIRGLVAQLAPAAQTSDSTRDSSQEQRLAISLLVALLGAALALMIQLTTAVATISGAQQARSAIAAMGISRRLRVSVSLRVIGPTLLGVALSALLVVLVAPRLGYLAPASIGWAWSIPMVVQLVVLIALGGVLLRAPRQ